MRVLPCLYLLLVASAAQVQAQGACSSDGAARPAMLVERFTSDRCEDCWKSAQPPLPANAVALDWIVPGGDSNAPLSAAALPEARQRLQSMGLVPDARSRETRLPMVPAARPGSLRLAQGPVVNDYIGVSVHWKPSPGDLRVANAWVLLVEDIPAGAAGAPAARRLVRGAWSAESMGGSVQGWDDRRAMHVPEGADPTRLRLVGWLTDRHGTLGALAVTRCAP